MDSFAFDIFLCLAVIFDATTSAGGKAINSYAGPYIPIVNRAYPCEDNKNVSIYWTSRASHYNPKKPTEKQHFTGYIKVGQPFNDSYWAGNEWFPNLAAPPTVQLTVLIDRRNNNQWKENAFVMKFPKAGCTAVVVNTPWLIRVAGRLFKRSSPCLISQGTIDVDGPVAISFPNVPIMPYGEFRFRVIGNVIGRTEHAICAVADCMVYPKI